MSKYRISILSLLAMTIVVADRQLALKSPVGQSVSSPAERVSRYYIILFFKLIT